MMWLCSTKSRRGQNQNFFNWSQNRTRLNFRLCICHSIFAITFSSSVILRWIKRYWKANSMYYKSLWNTIFLIQKFDMPKVSHNKRPQIWTNLESFSFLDWVFFLLLKIEDQPLICFLSLKKKCEKLETKYILFILV
jgi:hypothetical protein